MDVDPGNIAAAVVTVVVALTGATVTIIGVVVSAKKELLSRALATDKKADEIHALVNGSSTLAASKLTDLERQIAALHIQLEQVQERRVEDAKTRAAQDSGH